MRLIRWANIALGFQGFVFIGLGNLGRFATP